MSEDRCEQQEKEKKWRKILYERQPFEDEYSGGSEFLKELRTNITVVEYSFVEAICGASLVMLHTNAIVFYYLMFDSIKNSSISSVQHFSLIFAIALALYTAYLYMIRPRNLRDHVYTFITLLCFGYMLTPIIRTLTDTISTDTIYAMSFILFLTSFVFHDYTMVAPLVSTILSVNLSLAASVCLVSRVSSNESAFGLLALSMLLFSYWPQMRNCITSAFLLTQHPILTCTNVCSPNLSINSDDNTTVEKMYFSTKHGPWDEAIATFE
ncbi:unnamed protein product [Acanthocheilonema viteae]|uniref:Phosphatidylinositol N-acetylglucosaminyltransferase subunit C n=1 Tax=Acanthocheilonema viteae TaxID=6277 RepID=A0A498S2V8_ACAVI|nr:unnamed protein product [Acanthocheilonema viteae]